MGQAMKVNNGTVNAAGCDLVVNSSDPDNALYIASNGSVEADDIYVNGGTDNKGYLSSTPHEGIAQRSDPLANLPPPSTTGCDDTDVSLNGGSHTLSPGVYCGGIKVSGGADVTLLPGTYVITDSALNEGVFATSGNGTLQGDGVTFYFEGDNVAQLTGNGAVDLKAPETGVYTGMLMYGDQAAPTTTSHQVNGGGNIVFDGVMYFPTAELKYNGNGAGSSDADISAVIARELRFGGNGTLNFAINNTATVPPALITKLTLVE